MAILVVYEPTRSIPVSWREMFRTNLTQLIGVEKNAALAGSGNNALSNVN